MTTLASVRGLLLIPVFVSAPMFAQESRAAGAESKPDPRTRLDRFEKPEVVSLTAVTAADGVAVVTSAGVVHVFDAKSGQLRRTVTTGVSAWRRAVEGNLADEPMAAMLRGAPIALQDDTVLAVDGNKLLEFDVKGAKRVVCDSDKLAGATVVRGTGRDKAVLVGTRKGLLCAIAAGKVTVAPQPLDEAVLVLAVAPNRAWCLSAGQGPNWHVRDLATLSLTRDAGNHIGEEFIYVIDVARDSKHIVVAHGYSSCRIKAFSVEEHGLVGEFDAFRNANGLSTTVAYDASMRLLAAGDETGKVRVMPSGVGDPADLPHSTEVKDEGGRLLASSSTNFSTGRSITVSDLGSWRVDEVPIRGVCFADEGRLVISVNRSGAVVARSWPAGDVKWTKTITM